MKNILRKKYARLIFKLASPLAVGSGDNRNTDSDIIKDVEGHPYIPASAIAGVMRELYRCCCDPDDEHKKTDSVFGYVKLLSEDSLESSLTFYDARIIQGKEYVAVRDSVALDDYKTAVPGAKFDREILCPGVLFETILEQDFRGGVGEADVLEDLLKIWSTKDVFLGAKTTRGYGRTTFLNAFTANFDFSAVDTENGLGINDWLSFSPYDRESSCWKPWQPGEGGDTSHRNSVSLCLKLKQTGGIIIRRYSTEVSTKDKTMPDHEQLTCYDAGTDREHPVIPGSSWAGAFRHHVSRDFHVPDEIVGKYFGEVSEKQSVRSRIRFGESEITGGGSKMMTRTAIDRFSGGAANTALFTEKAWYGGETTLTVSIDTEDIEKEDKAMICALAAAAADLHAGLLTVGGLDSVGKGLFQVCAVNGTEFRQSPEELYRLVLKTIYGKEKA